MQRGQLSSRLSRPFCARWNWPIWWRSAVIFYAIWVLLYTSFFTNIGGLGSGMWQSLGYWLVQQGVARGSQPLYYYLVIGPLYEFLPLILAIAGGIYYLRRRDPFGHFLVFWAATTFILYSAATFDARASCLMAWCIASAASRPSLMPQTTSDAPRTISPAAYTPGRLVSIVE